MADRRVCPNCGEPLREGSAMEACPACLLSAALDPTGSGSPRNSSSERIDTAPTPSLPEVIGPYRILGWLGAGGMGEVYLAEQSRPLRRRVAVKIIKRGMDTEQVIARFESERQALALMNHPNIARVFDAGEQDGRPYFVMEYVPGIPITEYCDRQRLTTRERLGLFTLVCQAVQHAHQKGIIHRDLKPSNVLVAVQDGQPVPKVIDFGVAKATDQRLTERTLFTQHGLLVGTPEYMSPEQAELTGLDVDTRTDIYSLGVLLYELLVGTLPFDAQSLRRAGFDEMRRIIREDDPVKPSTRISSLGDAGPEIAKRRHTDLKALGRQLRGDLEWITLKALEKNPTRRYSTASEFAGDIERHLAGDPVLAGPPGISYRVQKLVLKHRRAAAFLAFGAAGLAIAAVISTGLYVRSERFRRAEEWQSYVANVRAAGAALEEGAAADARRRLEAAPERLRNWEWYYLWERLDSSMSMLSANHGPVRGVAFDPDGSRIFSYTDKTVDEWDAATGALVRSTTLGAADETIVSVSRDGTKAVLRRTPADLRTALTLTRGAASFASMLLDSASFFSDLNWEGESRIANVRTGETILPLGSGVLALSGQWTPDGSRLLAMVTQARVGRVSEDETQTRLQLWDVERRTLRKAVDVAPGASGTLVSCGPYAMSRDGRYFAAAVGSSAASQLSTVAIFDIAGKRLVSREMDGCSLAFDEAREERLLVAAPGRIQVWNFQANLIESTFPAEGQTGLFVARDGDVLFAGRDASLRARGYDVSGLRYGHTRAITDVAMSPDGAALATSSEDGSVRLWATSSASLTGHRVLKSLVFWPAQLSTTVSRVLVAGDTIDVFDLAGGNRLISQNRIRSILRRKSASLSCNGPAEVCEQPIFVSGEDSAVAALSSDGLRLAASDKSDDKPGTIVVFDVDSDQKPLELRGHLGPIDALAFTPSGEMVLSASRDRTVRVWNARSGEMRRVMEGLPGVIATVAIAPGGNLAVAGFVDGSVRIWDLRTGGLLDTLAGHTDAVRSLAFTPDGRHLITASTDETVNVWDIASAPGRRIHRLVHTGPVSAVTVSPDGSRIVTSSIALSERSYDGVARVWDVASGELLLTIRRPDAALTSVAFTRDGRSVVFSSPFNGESLGGAVGVWETRAAGRERGTR